MTKKEHYAYLDYLRIFACFGVVFMHTVSGQLWIDPAAIGRGWHLYNAGVSLFFTAVPIFFMTSGFLLLGGSKTGDTSLLLKKRLPRLVLPLAFWSVVACVLQSIYSQEGFAPAALAGSLAKSLLSPAMVHFWFMYTLIALYVISPILHGGVRALDRKGRLYLFVLICAVITAYTVKLLLPAGLVDPSSGILASLSMLAGALPVFMLGWYAGTLKRRISNLLLVLVGAADLAVIIIFTYLRTVSGGAYDQTFQTQNAGFEVLLALCIFIFFKQNFNSGAPRLGALARPLAALTFPIYLEHNVLLFVLTKYIAVGTLTAAALTVGNFVFCYFFSKTLATIKPLCFITTGMSYAQACESCNWIYTLRRIKNSSRSQ